MGHEWNFTMWNWQWRQMREKEREKKPTNNTEIEMNSRFIKWKISNIHIKQWATQLAHNLNVREIHDNHMPHRFVWYAKLNLILFAEEFYRNFLEFFISNIFFLYIFHCIRASQLAHAFKWMFYRAFYSFFRIFGFREYIYFDYLVSENLMNETHIHIVYVIKMKGILIEKKHFHANSCEQN